MKTALVVTTFLAAGLIALPLLTFAKTGDPIVRIVNTTALGSHETKTVDQHVAPFTVESSTAGSVLLKPNRCVNKDGTSGPCTRPDLTAGPSITVAGHVTPWGGNVTLTDADSIARFKPHCAFNIAYVLKNVGLGNAGPPTTSTFQDVLYLNNEDMLWAVGRQSGLTLPPSTYWVQHQAVYLLLGDNRLYLRIDNGNHIGESNENNNLFYVTYHLSGNCENPLPFHALLP